MMKIEMITTMDEIDAWISENTKIVDDSIIEMLSHLGDLCVAEATDNPSWYDRTGNLRSSIGYVVVVNGEIVKIGGFKQVLGASEGVMAGKDLAMELAGNHPEGYALIVVAGMHYAVYVEAISNKVVLASGELLARRELPKLLQKLENNINR